MKKKSNLPVPTSKKTQALSLRKQTMVGMIAVTTLVLATISDSRLAKMDWEIIKIKVENKFPVCQQYALKVIKSGKFPCHQCPNGEIYLNFGEVWRYGFAGWGGEKARYPRKVYYKEGKWELTHKHLYYDVQLKGTRPECLIEEKVKIYHYPELPEAQARDIKLIRPPGNKQDR